MRRGGKGVKGRTGRRALSILLAAFATVLACAQMAFAADLGAGLAVQDSSPVLSVYVQAGDSGTRTLVHAYTQEELEGLKASSSDPVSALYTDHENGGMKVCTTTSYVLLERLVVDAETKSGLSLDYDDPLTGVAATSGSAFAPDSIPLREEIDECCWFYPEVASDGTVDDSNPRKAEPVIALLSHSTTFKSHPECKTTGALETWLADYIAGGGDAVSHSPRFIYGISHDQLLGKSEPRGNRLTQVMKELTFITHKGRLASVAPVSVQAYTGKELKPSLSVKGSDGAALVAGHDYTATYTNNVNTGTAKVEIIGTGEYVGSLSTTFIIKKQEQPAASKPVTKKAPRLTKVTSKTYKIKNLRKKASTFKAFKVTTDGKVAYKVVQKDSKKRLTFKNGKVTVKKGTKKGTYKLKVKVSAKAGKNYKALAAKTYTVKVRVK